MRNITNPHRGNYLKHILIVGGISIPTLILFILVFVVPFGAEYKKIKQEIKLVERNLKVAEMGYEDKKAEFQELSHKHEKLLSELRNPKSVEELKRDNQFIQSITPLSNRWSEDKLFKKEVYQLETKYLYTTLDNIYDLLKNSSEYGFRFGVDFPIEFKSNKGKIKAKMAITIYKLKPIKRDLVRPFTEIQK